MSKYFDLKKYGFRKDFNYDTRFHLCDYVNGYYISTVDLGIDHSFGIGNPLYYETMIFKEGSWDDLYCKTYSTKKQAIKGHHHAIYISKYLESSFEKKIN